MELRKDKFAVHLIIFFLAVVMFISVSLFKLYVNQRILDIGYDISRANAVRTKLFQTRRRLELELQNLKNPDRIKEFAEANSMRMPASQQIVYINVE